MKKYIFIIFLACSAAAAWMLPVSGSEIEVIVNQRGELASKVTPADDPLLFSVDQTQGRIFTRLENTRINIVSFFHRRKIGEAVVEKDFIRYQFDTETGELIESTKKWRDDLPDDLMPIISQEQAEKLVEGNVTSVQLVIISPESDIFKIDPVPYDPCWIFWSDVEGAKVITIIDSMYGEKLGYGVPPPYEGLSIHGPDHPPNCDNNNPWWLNHAQNAETWFETMGYDTLRIPSATGPQLAGHIQSDSTVMFYELDHGGSTNFRTRCEYLIYAAPNPGEYNIEEWIENYATMGFAFIGSCAGMCSTGDNTFSHEFRKGMDTDTVVVGYCGMSQAVCEDDCWGDAIPWQTELFDWMNDGYRVGYAFERANLAYPDCTDDGHNCMRISGDENLIVAGSSYPNMKRSFCGSIYDLFGISPMLPVLNRTFTRAHHIRCNSSVPSTYQLTIYASTSYPYNEVAFLNNAELTAYGVLEVETGNGTEISLVSVQDRNKGIHLKPNGCLHAYNGGGIKIYE